MTVFRNQVRDIWILETFSLPITFSGSSNAELIEKYWGWLMFMGLDIIMQITINENQKNVIIWKLYIHFSLRHLLL